mmetsp:Transcript_66809/g.189638  ORF Transcript_66809/g.189638 Transcript_66809/m.189638 type:complete len:267 (+) Transcript_66809:1-801(+)
MDADRSGYVSYAEFVEQVFRLKSRDSRTTLMFLRDQVRDVQEKFDIFKGQIAADIKGQIAAGMAAHSLQITSDLAAHGALLSEIAGTLRQKDCKGTAALAPAGGSWRTGPGKPRKRAAPRPPLVPEQAAAPAGEIGGAAGKSAWSAGLSHVRERARADLNAVVTEALCQDRAPVLNLPALCCSPRHQSVTELVKAPGQRAQGSLIKRSVVETDALKADANTQDVTAWPRIEAEARGGPEVGKQKPVASMSHDVGLAPRDAPFFQTQ